MTRAGMKTALDHGARLPAFKDLDDARTALFNRRDKLLESLEKALLKTAGFVPDYTPESLKELEAWYFRQLEKDGFDSIELEREELEVAISMYLGESFVRWGGGFEWVVEEYVFAPGKYEIGVRKNLCAIMLSRRNPELEPNDRRRQSLLRFYRTYTA